ncbi:MAG: hypothetical protein US11_C0001G0076 [Candidatus Roizmanbacteria bacterium GW2011_GWA2_36_23]|uniref:Uncharacterized protein n=1 Tax=Candidatus Roizmanbacteria bacterium GW2011_GWA2_36_23 TaxID=1618480 RepID=A0A0G0E9F0_9BACT|nr:MAG: hypothetical protein US11_C0001G0076 [Candidatus Roizmanbacteria bacterium GW2011_GWA2_36_23]
MLTNEQDHADNEPQTEFNILITRLKILAKQLGLDHTAVMALLYPNEQGSDIIKWAQTIMENKPGFIFAGSWATIDLKTGRPVNGKPWREIKLLGEDVIDIGETLVKALKGKNSAISETAVLATVVNQDKTDIVYQEPIHLEKPNGRHSVGPFWYFQLPNQLASQLISQCKNTPDILEKVMQHYGKQNPDIESCWTKWQSDKFPPPTSLKIIELNAGNINQASAIVQSCPEYRFPSNRLSL